MSDPRIWRSIAAALAAGAALFFTAAGAAPAESAKIDNVLAGETRPLAASGAQFLEAALLAPKAGACEVLSPDPGFVEEMLLDVSTIGAPGGRKYEQRVALVVGNGAYKSVSTLRNPPNDATSMARMFRALGFTVYRAIDATEKSLDECFARFKGDLEARDAQGAKADIALFFYAGHGVQLTSTADNEKRNYMLSVDAAVDAAGKAKGFRQVDTVLSEMRQHSRQAVFLYDACRNAPYRAGTVTEADGQSVRAFDAAGGAAAISARAGDLATEAGLFIAYATSPGETADDAWGPEGSAHSPFTEALLKNLPTPGAILEEALANAYYDVGALTRGRQTPWTSSSLQEAARLNGSARLNDVTAASSERAAQSAAAAGLGRRGEALAEALKGLPRAAPGRRLFGPARAALYRAHVGDVEFVGHDNAVRAVALSPDGSRLATASADRRARIWNAETGATIAVLEGHAGVLRDIAFSPDGARVATASDDQTARIWDARSGAPLFTLKHDHRVQKAAFNLSGTRLAVAAGVDGLALWNARTGARVAAFTTPQTDFTNAAAFSPDGRLVAAAYDGGRLAIWSVDGATMQKSFNVKDCGAAIGAGFSPDGRRLVVACEVGPARLLDAATGAETARLQGHTDRTTSATFIDNARVLTSSIDRTLRIWDAGTGAPLHVIEDDGADLSAAASPDGRRIVSASNEAARAWNLAARLPDALVAAHEGVVSSIAYAPDGRSLATGSWDGRLRIADAATGAARRTIEITHEISAVAFTPDSSRVAAVGNFRPATIYNAKTGESVVDFGGGHEDVVRDVAVSPDGRVIATASDDNTARTWNAQTGEELATFAGHQSFVWGVSFSSDGRRLATAAFDGSARIWDAQSGGMLREIGAGEAFQRIEAVSFSPSSDEIAAAPIGPLARIWNSTTGAPALTLVGHGAPPRSVAYSADGARLVTTAGDGRAIIWDGETGALIAAFRRSESGARPAAHPQSAVFSPDGRRIAVGYDDGMLALWSAGLHGQELLNAAYDAIGEDLRAEVERERIRYWEVAPELLQ